MKDIKLILFDVDLTLIYGEKANLLYKEYSKILENTLAKCLQVSQSEGKQIADQHREMYNGQGEKAFLTQGIGIDKWYDALIDLAPEKYLEPLPKTMEVLQALKEKGLLVGVITDGPRKLAEKILFATKINSDLFDLFYAWEKNEAMPKGGLSDIYKKVCSDFKLEPHEVMMVGDSLGSDVLPAIATGLRAVHITDMENNHNNKYITLKNIEELSKII
ncbi:HAD family hydrolase [Candidatus Falkowbacteria bacterium]|jgi:FMN phosphatase YigB (HAD superfamily)|nr:HAD family hydrolase [Candidatus Falkowbacteria bacterium]MBT5502602.1 HAD family hydrolase [Candidatus Falkowbacteria bacterium]MBT6574589.1 HAD family hydrolase [Candidatus Falkowbacteria bacterium]MBT7349000.1 HAD family hydrolase [Candidatus Falkowbacteria bacterium]MBT7500342.1 HAD family hydrolase [Candidatus Falkowbacteria bacterium]